MNSPKHSQAGGKLPFEKHAQSGFTLLELMVAITVFAFMSAAAYSGLHNSIKADENFRRSMKEVEAVQMTFVLLEKEIAQRVPRPIRDEFGDEEPALVLEAGRELTFTRGGNFSALQMQQAELTRIRYGLYSRLEGDIFARSYWKNLDRVQGDEPLTTTLLKDIQKLEIKILDNQNTWHDSWPAPDNTLKPRAVEVILEKEGWGEIRRLIQL